MSEPGVYGSGNVGRIFSGRFEKPLRAYQSGGFIPAAWTWTSTSPGPGSGRGTSSTARTPGSPVLCMRTAFIVGIGPP
ncbi:hypothetical protein GCM10027612_81930 [Microbispora bryophytorum subsp. camponoti]